MADCCGAVFMVNVIFARTDDVTSASDEMLAIKLPSPVKKNIYRERGHKLLILIGSRI